MFAKNIKLGFVGVALMGALFVGCGNSIKNPEFEPKSEFDNKALKLAQEKIPNTKFYRLFNEYGKDITLKNNNYLFLFMNSNNEKSVIDILCFKSNNNCTSINEPRLLKVEYPNLVDFN